MVNITLDLIGNMGTLFSIIIIFLTAIAWMKGILPVLIRLGIGLAKRKIVIFANGEFSTLKSLLVGSNIFNKENIDEISSMKDIWKSEKSTVFLVSWNDWKNNIDDILIKVKNGTALIIYAPPRAIPDDQMKKLDLCKNTVVSNFRGRLLNDIVNSMITTGNEISFWQWILNQK